MDAVRTAIRLGADDCVHDNPWRAVGIAAVGGLLLGLLIARK